MGPFVILNGIFLFPFAVWEHYCRDPEDYLRPIPPTDGMTLEEIEYENKVMREDDDLIATKGYYSGTLFLCLLVVTWGCGMGSLRAMCMPDTVARSRLGE